MAQAGTAFSHIMNGGMFEKYSDQARRALFFARHEASVLAGREIEPHHLLLGVLKEPDPLIEQLVIPSSADTLRRLICERAGRGTFFVTHSVEIAFGRDVKLVLQHANEQSDRLLHRHVGPEHLLLGLLCLERGLAWDILREQRLALAPVREALVMHVSANSPPPAAIARLINAMRPDTAAVPRGSGSRYRLTAIDGPSPGRRAVVADTIVFTSVGSVGFATRSDRPAEDDVLKIGPISMSAATLAQFVRVLEAFLGSPVINDTGLSGLFEIELRGEYEDIDPLIAALREQLGLVLTRSVG